MERETWSAEFCFIVLLSPKSSLAVKESAGLNLHKSRRRPETAVAMTSGNLITSCSPPLLRE